MACLGRRTIRWLYREKGSHCTFGKHSALIVKDHQKQYLKLYRKICSIEKLQERRLKENEIRASYKLNWPVSSKNGCVLGSSTIWYHWKRFAILSGPTGTQKKKGHKENSWDSRFYLCGEWLHYLLEPHFLLLKYFRRCYRWWSISDDIPSFLPIYRSKRIVVIGDPINSPIVYVWTNGRAGHQELNVHLPKQYLRILLFSIQLSPPSPFSYHYRCPTHYRYFGESVVYNNKFPQREDKTPDALCWISINGQAKVAEHGSICNEMEALQIVKTIMKYRLNWENQEFNIGVISPFRGQVQLIQSLLKKKCPYVQILVDTAHRFQGDERDIILMSLVVTPHSSKRQFEFAMDAQLMNVSLTRAKQRLWIYSHPQNPKKNQMLREIFQTSSKINTNFEAIDTLHPHE